MYAASTIFGRLLLDRSGNDLLTNVVNVVIAREMDRAMRERHPAAGCHPSWTMVLPLPAPNRPTPNDILEIRLLYSMIYYHFTAPAGLGA
jgi:hypothetical protein